MKKRRAPTRGRDFWHGHIHAWLASGLSKPDYCSQHHLSIKSFYRWDRMRRKAEPTAIKNVPLIPLITADAEPAPAFAATAGTSAGIRIHVSNQFVVDLAVGFDVASLERLWKTWG